MPGTTTSGSPNIAVLDLKIVADLCAGQFCSDITPSSWIASGKDNVQGAKFQITDPYNVIIRPYPSSFDIAPAFSPGMDGSLCYNVPTMAGNYKYGKYTISVELTDADGTKYYNTKTVTICAPNSKDKTQKYGTLSAKMTASCKDGKMFIIVDTVPNYNGRTVESQVNDFELLYPTISGLDPLETSYGAFSVQVYEGSYIFQGEICATYNFTDNVFVKIKYNIKKEHTVRCLIDECCVYAALEELHLRLASDCTAKEIETTTSIILEAVALLKQIELAGACGKDATQYILDLEKLLGCSCSCNCAVGTPIINNTPTEDFLIEGCGVESTTVGLTTIYTINNYEYVVSVAENGGVLVAAAAVQDGCVKTQTLTFNIVTAYGQIKNLANLDETEAAFWASIINKMLTSIDASCIVSGWSAMSLNQRITAIINAICVCCNCSATIDVHYATREGSDVVITWETTNSFAVDVYVDGIFKGRVLSGIYSFLVAGVADGQPHTYVLIPSCSNNKFGTTVTGDFTYIGCPTITPPVVSSNFVNDTCPYDLESLLSAAPVGITYEWHTQNNTNSSSLMANPGSASSGVYYVFAKDSNGCFSIASEVTLVCVEATSCTAPQSLLVTSVSGGFLTQFQSAAFAPPSNSYTIKRRLQSAPDIDPSYTTIGTPAWNSSTNRWELLDTTASNNTLYVYKAISNCGGSPPTTPYTTYEFANLQCPSLTTTPGETTLDYSFFNVGGDVDQYVVKLYDSTGTVLLATNTHTPAFASPIVGSFTGLTANTTYRYQVTAYIGSYTKVCTMTTTQTTPAAGNAIYWFLNGYIGARLIIYDNQSPPVEALNILSTGTPQSGSLTGLTGSYNICVEWASGSGNKIKMRVCDAYGNEVAYDGNIVIGDPATCFATISMPTSSAPYYVYVTAGDIEPDSCS